MTAARPMGEALAAPSADRASLTIWSEQRIPPGDRRDEQIARHLEQANIIVLLLSSDLFADRDCYKLMELALPRSQSGQVRVIPLLLRPVDWRSSLIGQRSCLPTNGHSITEWRDRDAAFKDCVNSLTELLTPPEAAQRASVHNFCER
ncbi:MAG TPA: toll/interleukin-1 receptor domain-containing protein [Ktedonobacteraceae bacterium]|nr:toll/interleukin-1 receptor domain-containing protein [Ktedonobacteraceae bacterium]